MGKTWEDVTEEIAELEKNEEGFKGICKHANSRYMNIPDGLFSIKSWYCSDCGEAWRENNERRPSLL